MANKYYWNKLNNYFIHSNVQARHQIDTYFENWNSKLLNKIKGHEYVTYK